LCKRSTHANEHRGKRREPAILKATRLLVEALACCAASLLVRLPFAGITEIGPDEGLYALGAQRWLLGELPYVAVWDHHPPALQVLLAIPGWFGGDALAGARGLATLSVAATCFVLLAFSRVLLGNRAAGIVAACCYLLATTGRDGLALSSELVDNALITAAAALLLLAIGHPPPRRWQMTSAGLALGVSLQVKFADVPHLLLLVPAFWIWSRARLPLALLLACIALPSVALLLYFASNDALHAMLDALLGGNLAYLADLRNITNGGFVLGGARPIGGLLLATSVLAIAPAWRLAVPHARRWMLLWLLACAIGVCMPMHFYRHHFHLLLPPACLCTGIAATWLAGLVPRQGRLAALAAAALLLAAPTLRSTLMDRTWLARLREADPPRRIADEILRRNGVDASLYVACDHPVLYVLTRARPPRDIFWRDQAGQGGLEAALQSRPAFVVAEAGDSDPILLEALRDYDLALEAPSGSPGVPALLLYARR
jgi:hypothetical protein